MRDVSYIGETTFHRRYQRFGIKQTDRLSHVHVLGKTGVGKSTLLEGLARQDLVAGRGFALSFASSALRAPCSSLPSGYGV